MASRAQPISRQLVGVTRNSLHLQSSQILPLCVWPHTPVYFEQNRPAPVHSPENPIMFTAPNRQTAD